MSSSGSGRFALWRLERLVLSRVVVLLKNRTTHVGSGRRCSLFTGMADNLPDEWVLVLYCNSWNSSTSTGGLEYWSTGELSSKE
jgi:hypothetical protein